MALELKKLMSRPVISVTTGREMGIVDKLLFEPGTHQLYGFGVRPKHKKDAELLLLRRDVKAIGADAITIDSDDKVTVFQEDMRANELTSLGAGLKGMRIVTEDGNQLGKMATLMLAEDGTIEAYHASTGIMGFGKGRDIQPGNVLIAGEDAIIVSARENDPTAQTTMTPQTTQEPPQEQQRMAA